MYHVNKAVSKMCIYIMYYHIHCKTIPTPSVNSILLTDYKGLFLNFCQPFDVVLWTNEGISEFRTRRNLT